MTKTTLGRLKKVDLRTAWDTESGDFTPWLAGQENLSLLGEVLDLDLELESQEKNVGPFRADLLCKDTATGHWVLIENQIERTDHTHLGQLLTYAAGLKAVTIVWVSSRFTDEHRAALDWLNEVTDEGINFFGLEIELWQIGDSPVAPKFNVISKPNEWYRTVTSATTEKVSVIGQLQLDFWTEFNTFMHLRKSFIKPQKPLPQAWMNFAIGRVNFYLIGVINIKAQRMRIGLVITSPNSKEYFHLLLDQKEFIESHLGQNLDWEEAPGKVESHIYLHRLDSNLYDRELWAEYFTWMAENLEALHKVLSPLVRKISIPGV